MIFPLVSGMIDDLIVKDWGYMGRSYGTSGFINSFTTG